MTQKGRMEGVDGKEGLDNKGAAAGLLQPDDQMFA